MKRFSEADSDNLWKILHVKLAETASFPGFLSRSLIKDDAPPVIESPMSPEAFPYGEDLLLKYNPRKSFSQTILINEALVSFFKAKRIVHLLLMNTLSVDTMVDFSGRENRGRDVLEITPFELESAVMGKHYIPEVVFADEFFRWVIYMDYDDCFHVAGPPDFVKEFVAFMKKFVQPWRLERIH